jgi:VCBS repeat-containing protein
VSGDQIIAYQGTHASPTVLYAIDFADGDSTFDADATSSFTSAIPTGLTLGVTAVAIPLGNGSYAGPNSGSPTEVLAAIGNSANWISSVSSPTLFTFDFRPELDLDGNNSTAFGDDYATEVTSGGPAVRIADTDADIDDIDDFFISQAVIDIRGTDPGDLLAVNGSLPFGIFATPFNPSNGTLTLFGLASHAAYQTAIEQIVFSTTRPVGTVKTIDVNVFDGREWSNEASAIIQVTSAATPPVLDLDANNSNGGGFDYTATATGGGPGIPIADTDVSITDADSTTIQSARITIGINRRSDDLLSIAGTLPTGITASSYNSSTGVITLSGAASLAAYQTALHQVVYSTPDTTPFTGDRIITVTVNDGTFNSNTATTYMHVVAPPANVPPVNTVPGAQSVNEDTALPIAGVSVADVDSIALTTTLTVSSGTIHVNAGAGVTGNDSASVTIAGTAAQINAALAGLTYTGTLNFNGADTLAIATSDTIATDTDTIAITVNAVNDAPVNTVPGAQSVAEDTALPISGVSVADVDSSALTTTLNVSSGTLTVIAGAGVSGNGTPTVTIAGTAAQINAALAGLTYTGNLNFNGADTLTVVTSDGTASDADTIAITVNAVNDAPVNTLPGAQSVAEDTALPIAGVSVADVDTGVLTTTLSVLDGKLTVIAGAGVTGNGTASVTIIGTAAQINASLAGLSYTGNLDFNGADTLTIATDDGTAIDSDTIAITVTAVNDAPVLNLDANSSTIGGVDYLTSFTDGGGAVAIADTDVLITDSDDTQLVSATITLTNPDIDDVLAAGTLPAAITASSYNPSTGVLTLTGTASLADYQTALRQITFDNTGTTPSTDTRIIDVVVDDGTVASNLARAIIQVTEVNNSAPTLDLDGNDSTVPGTSYRTTFTENGPAVAIADTDTLIGDADSSDLASATITLTDPHAGDLLAASGALPGGITASSYDPGTGILTLSGIASLADYASALQAIRFSSDADTPVAGTRIIEVVVSDGVNESQAAISRVAVVAVNDAPALVVADASYQENAAPVLLSPSASLTDADDSELDLAAVQITAGSFPGNGDVLTIGGATSGTVTGITFTWDATLHALVLTGASSVANYQALLQAVQFRSTSDNPTDFGASPQRTLTWSASDGTALTTTTTTLDITAANDAPVNTVPGAQSVAEDTATPIPGVSVADVDSSTLTTTLTVSSGTLNVIAGAGVTGHGTASVTIIGTAAQINTALAGLTYTGNLNFNGADTLTVATSDGAASDIDTIAITVNAVNDPPVNTVPGAQSVAEDTALPIAGVSVADVDSSALTTTLSVSSGRLNVTAGPGVTGNGTATITIAGTAAEINAALAALSYTGNLNFNGADTLTIATSDGSAINTDTIAITVNAVNDAPALIVSPNATFVENAVPELLSPSVGLADLDDSNLEFASVQITDGSFAGDGDVLTVGGLTSGTVVGITFTWDPTLHALILNGTSSVGNYQALLQAVEFQSTSDNPTDFGTSPERTLTWTVSDGTDATTTTTTVAIAAVNDAPQETVAASAAYTENAAPVTISPGATASDVDDVELVHGVVRIADGWVDGDLLTVNGLESGTFSGIDFSYRQDLHALEFSHPTSVGDYQAFMRAVQFSSTSDNPTNFGANPTRTLSWGLSDGEAYSAAAQRTQIVISAVDDPAVARNDAFATFENSAIVTGNVLADNGAGADSDPDTLSFFVTAVTGGTLGTQFALPSGALLTVNANGTFSYDPNHKFDYLPAPGSGASDLSVTDTFSYTITGGSTATVTVRVSGVDTDDVLTDSPGIDSLAGGTGNDVYYVSNTSDAVTEVAGAGFDTVAASVNYTLPASNTVEVLNMLGAGLTGTGTGGAETFISSNGPNTLIGLGGNDTYYVNSSADVVVEAAGGGMDTVQATVDYTLPGENTVEGLYMLGAGLTGTGSNGAETLYSSGGPNILVGLGGDDSYYVNNTADVVTEAPGGGADRLTAFVNYTLPANVEGLYMQGAGLTGTGSNNGETLYSNGGGNTLVGLGGNDAYYVNGVTDVVVEAANGGTDTVAASINYTIPANVEGLYLLGAGLTGTGSNGGETLYSNGGPNTLVGLGGDDLYYVNNASDVVVETAGGGFDVVAATVNYTMPADVEVLNMVGAGLTGTGSNNAETLYSSGGPNTLIGLGGNDTYYVNNVSDVVVEAAGGGVDTVLATVDYTMPANAEVLNMIGAGLTGTGTNNADTFYSTGGPNTLVGLGGDDFYYISTIADVVVEAANGGFDSVQTSDNYTLPANVEALYLYGSGHTGTGNSSANTLVSFGANTLVGGNGDDTFVLFAGSADGTTISDFFHNQVDEWDFLVFSGFGTEAQGAAVSQIGSTDQWQIHSGLDGQNETITLSNHATLHAGEFVFV